MAAVGHHRNVFHFLSLPGFPGLDLACLRYGRIFCIPGSPFPPKDSDFRNHPMPAGGIIEILLQSPNRQKPDIPEGTTR